MPTIDNWRALQETASFAKKIQGQSMEMDPATIRALLDERDRLAAEVEALRADAVRYRWLRKEPQWLGWEHDIRPDEIDREVDAAMKGKQ